MNKDIERVLRTGVRKIKNLNGEKREPVPNHPRTMP